MKLLKYGLLILPFFIIHTAFGQAKFQNNRFANLQVVAATIYTTDDFYLVFGFTEAEDKQLSKVFTKDDYDYLKRMTDQDNYPDSLKTMELQLANIDKFKKAKVYKLAEFDYGGDPTVILCVPVSENAFLKQKGMIDDKDLILVCQKKDIEKAK